MRERLMAPLALMVLVPATVWAAGRAAETCVSAGYRVGTAAFDTCVARVGGDDPLSALEGGALSVHADKGDRKTAEANPLTTLTPARPAVPTAVLPVQPAREDLPLSFNTPSPMAVPPPPPPPPPGGGNGGAPPSPSAGFGGWWPTAPTAPTLPAVVGPNVPAWNFGGQ